MSLIFQLNALDLLKICIIY